jgi:GT2 family glycosyltransferase
MHTPRLAIVIVNYNSWPDVARLVATFSASPEVRLGMCEIVVVDNASTDPQPAPLTTTPTGVRIILRPDNAGFARGVNDGWHATRAPWILLLNPDIVADSTLPRAAIERAAFHESRPQGPPAIVGFALKNPDGSRQPSVGAEPTLLRAALEAFLPRNRRKYRRNARGRAGVVPWVTGACALVDARVLEKTRGLDEDFFMYYEEVALAKSVRSLGARVEFDPAIEVVHLRPLQNRAVSPLLRVITRHSKMLYFQKFRPRLESRLIAVAVLIESIIRARFAVWPHTLNDAVAWRAISRIARQMLRDQKVVGADAYQLALDSIAAQSPSRSPQAHPPSNASASDQNHAPSPNPSKTQMKRAS